MDFVVIICNQFKQAMILLRINISHGFTIELGAQISHLPLHLTCSSDRYRGQIRWSSPTDAKLMQTEAAQDANCTCWGVKRVCVQGFGSNPCLNAKKKRDMAFCAALWVGSEVAYFKKVWDKFIQIIGIINIWLKVFWVFMNICLSVSGDVYNFERG